MLHTTENSSGHSPSAIIVNYKFTIPPCFNMPLMKQQCNIPRRDTVLRGNWTDAQQTSA